MEDSLASRSRAESLRKRVDALKSHTVVPQGTEEWLKARRLLLTASDVASFLTHSREHAQAYVDEFRIPDFRFSSRCASPYSSGKKVLRRKHGIVPSMGDNIYTSWGHTFEPVIRNWWRVLNGGKEVLEFGLITSSATDSSFLAASPDGINAELGLCLEFKAPLTRNICASNPVIPYHYWIQIQCQLHCCDLPVAHYLECSFSMYGSDDQYLDDQLDGDENKGVLLKYGTREIETPPLELWSDHLGQLQWAQENSKGGQLVRWKMVAWNLIETKRNKPWLASVMPTLRKAYRDLLHFDHAKAQKEEDDEREKRESRPKRAKSKPGEEYDSITKSRDMCGSESNDSGPEDLCGDESDLECTLG